MIEPKEKEKKSTALFWFLLFCAIGSFFIWKWLTLLIVLGMIFAFVDDEGIDISL